MYAPGNEGKLGYRVRAGRDWLDPAEGHELHDLLARYWAEKGSYPARLNRAMWRLEYAYSVRWADVILPVLVSGLEALLKTDRHPLTRQFVYRASALAAELGIPEIDRDFAERMYDGRSDWVHGAQVGLLHVEPKAGAEVTITPIPGQMEEALGELALLQDLLRHAVRRCIEDEEFRRVFVDDDTIRARLPVPAT
jgi:hypothetical protein